MSTVVDVLWRVSHKNSQYCAHAASDDNQYRRYNVTMAPGIRPCAVRFHICHPVQLQGIALTEGVWYREQLEDIALITLTDLFIW